MQGDLLTTWLAIEQAIENQISTIHIQAAQSQISTPLDIDQVILILILIRYFFKLALVIL